MEFESLVAAESGTVAVVEFTWPPPSPEQESYQCLAYVVMLRPQGFLLCIPEGFLTAEELEQGQQDTPAEGIGPSCSLEAPPVSLSPSGDWEVSQNAEPVLAVVVDMASSLASALAPADLNAPNLCVFREGEPAVFPIATEVIRIARAWLQGPGPVPEDRSGYQTAVSGRMRRPRRAKPKPPRQSGRLSSRSPISKWIL